jgi:hypothetical protein
MPDSLGLAVVSRVSPVDRMPFVRTLAQLAASGDLHLDEEKIVTAYAEAWDLDTTGRKRVRKVLRDADGSPLDEQLNAFEESNTPFLLLQELVRVSISDETYADADRDALASLANRLGFSADVLGDIEKWVERSTVWGNTSVDEHDDDALSDVLSRDEDSEYDLSDIPTADPDDLDRIADDSDGRTDKPED